MKSVQWRKTEGGSEVGSDEDVIVDDIMHIRCSGQNEKAKFSNG
jgi:hypothetical protein